MTTYANFMKKAPQRLGAAGVLSVSQLGRFRRTGIKQATLYHCKDKIYPGIAKLLISRAYSHSGSITVICCCVDRWLSMAIVLMASSM